MSVEGRLFELDGNNHGPVDLGPVGRERDAFLGMAVAHIRKQYVAPFPNAHFSLMALAPKQ